MEQFTKISSYVLRGLAAVPATVEVGIYPGIGVHMTGLIDREIKESLLRTVTAMSASGIHIPGKKIIINIAPAVTSGDISMLDLPIALGIALEAQGLHVRDIAAAGGLSLDGKVRPVKDADRFVSAIADRGIAAVLLPPADTSGPTDTGNTAVHRVNSLAEAVSLAIHLTSAEEQTEQ